MWQCKQKINYVHTMMCAKHWCQMLWQLKSIRTITPTYMSSADLVSVHYAISQHGRWLQTGPQKITKLSKLGEWVLVQDSACLRQYSTTQMFKLIAKYIDCSKWRKFRCKILHWIVLATNNYPFDAIINIILPSSIHCKMLWQNYQRSNFRGLEFHKTM